MTLSKSFTAFVEASGNGNGAHVYKRLTFFKKMGKRARDYSGNKN